MPSKLVTAFALTTGLLALSGTQAQTSPPAIAVPVSVLPTSFAVPDMPAPTYPTTITVAVPPNVQVAAYGAAGRVWLGPQSWTGRGGVGVSGGSSVILYPTAQPLVEVPWVTDDRLAVPHVSYAVMAPSCQRCILNDAAVYFPEALTEWNKTYNSDGKSPVVVPNDLVAKAVTPRLVTYALPSENGLLVRGAAFYDPDGDGFYAEMRAVLPPADQGLAEVLVKYWGDHVGLP